jgi:DNA polymerase-3 subunit epsilon
MKIAVRLPTCNFIAIDFETATSKMHACQIGIVVVRNGIITERICHLIQPPGNEYGFQQKKKHRITPSKTTHSPLFTEIWGKINHLFHNATVIAHNVNFDRNVLFKNLNYYHLDSPEIDKWICTYNDIYGCSLEVACQENGIPLLQHHDALADAEACAKLYLLHCGITPAYASDCVNQTIEDRDSLREEYQDIIDYLHPIPQFEGKGFIITGVTSFDRDVAYSLIKRLGGHVCKSISNKVSIVVVGDEPGPAKMRKVEECQSNGKEIIVYTEKEFIELMKEIKDDI